MFKGGKIERKGRREKENINDLLNKRRNQFSYDRVRREV